MGSAQVFAIVGIFVAVTGVILGAITARIAYKYRSEIKQAERRRVVKTLRAHYVKNRPEPKPDEAKEDRVLAGVGH